MDDIEEQTYNFLLEVSASDVFSFTKLLAKELEINERFALGILIHMWDKLQEKKAKELGYRTISNG
jgi:hypothetical protein